MLKFDCIGSKNRLKSIEYFDEKIAAFANSAFQIQNERIGCTHLSAFLVVSRRVLEIWVNAVGAVGNKKQNKKCAR